MLLQFYETGLVDKKLWPFGEDLRKRFDQTRVSHRADSPLHMHMHNNFTGRHPASSALRIFLAPHATTWLTGHVWLPAHECTMLVSKSTSPSPDLQDLVVLGNCVLTLLPVSAQTLLLKVMDHKKLLETNDDVMLQQKLALRAPYITPLNILQVSACPALPCPNSTLLVLNSPKSPCRPLLAHFMPALVTSCQVHPARTCTLQSPFATPSYDGCHVISARAVPISKASPAFGSDLRRVASIREVLGIVEQEGVGCATFKEGEVIASLVCRCTASRRCARWNLGRASTAPTRITSPTTPPCRRVPSIQPFCPFTLFFTGEALRMTAVPTCGFSAKGVLVPDNKASGS